MELFSVITVSLLRTLSEWTRGLNPHAGRLNDQLENFIGI